MILEHWSALVGFFLPALVSVVNREPWRPMIKAMVALAISAVGGTVTALLSGGLTGAGWFKAIGVAFVASQVFYHMWWRNSEITDWVERRVNLFTGRASAESVLGGVPGESGAERHSVDSD